MEQPPRIEACENRFLGLQNPQYEFVLPKYFSNRRFFYNSNVMDCATMILWEKMRSNHRDNRRRSSMTTIEPGFRSRTGSHEQGTNLPQQRQCVLPLRRRQLSVRCVTTVSKMELRAGAKKDFETYSRVSSLLQLCSSLTS
jgi:hypothetical protein